MSTALKAPNLDSLVELQERLLNQPNIATGKIITGKVSHGTPGTEFSFSHNLGRVPIGYVVIGKDKASSIYNGSTANTNALLYLKCDTATVTFDVIVF